LRAFPSRDKAGQPAPGGRAAFPPFLSFFSGWLLDAQVFDSVGLSRVFAGLSARAIDAYLFETKVEVVIQLCFQILRLSDELLIDPNSGALSGNPGVSESRPRPACALTSFTLRRIAQSTDLGRLKVSKFS
jgi:hypothetical protein